jgi:hypothetical protein
VPSCYCPLCLVSEKYYQFIRAQTQGTEIQPQ